MTAMQRKSAPSAAPEEDAHGKRLQLHNTTTLDLCQILRDTTAWMAVIGILGTAGGMDQGTISFLPGCCWLVVFLIVWIALLRAEG